MSKRCIGGISKPCPHAAAPVFCRAHNQCILRKLQHGLTYKDIAYQYELPARTVRQGYLASVR